MSKGFNHYGGRGQTIAKRQQQAAIAKKDRLAHYKRVFAERQQRLESEQQTIVSRPARNIDRYLEGLRRVPFIRMDRSGMLHPSETYEAIAKVALEAMNTNTKRAVLCWPNFAPAPAAVAAMLMLADCEAADQIMVDGYPALAAPWGLRTLVFPYARTSHRPLRHIYVEKNYLRASQIKHQHRSTGTGENAALADFHKTLARAGTLTGKTKDGNEYPEFAHPCLDELLPSGACSGNAGRSELLWRVRTKTDLLKLARTKEADDPNKAIFYLFGMWSNDNIVHQLKALSVPPELVLLQMDSVGVSRLGKNWEERLRSFLVALDERFGPLPVVALTDNPWIFDRLRFEALFSKARRRKEPPCASSVIFSIDSDIVSDAAKVSVDFAPIKNFDVVAYAGEVEKLLRRLRTDRFSASKIGDHDNTERLGQLVGVIRRCTSLPGSRAEFSEYLVNDCGQIAAAEYMVPYRVGALTKELIDSNGAWSQLAREELLDVCKNIQEVWERTDLLTPIKPMLRDLVVRRFLHNSSRTVLLFQSDLHADFAAHVLRSDEEIGAKIDERIEKSMIRFSDSYGLKDLDGLPRAERNHIKTLVVIAPNRTTMLELLSRPWLPENVIVLSDADTLENSARDTTRLGKYPELETLKERFEAFTAKAREAVVRVHGITVNLEQNLESHDDAEISSSRIVNLAGNVKENQELVKITLVDGHGGGQIVIAKPGSKLVVQDRGGILPIYKEVEAKSVVERDRICVIGDAFVEMARPLVNITRRAAEEIRDYHELVKAKFALLPGADEQSRLRALVEKMNVASVTPSRAHYWIELDEQLNAPLDEVVPRAPRDFETFTAFMKALGVTGPLIEKYWLWAVVAQRSHKLSAGMGMRDAYRGILVDSYSAQSDNPTHLQELRRLRAAAENFVGEIQKIESVRAKNEGIGSK